MTRRGFSLLEIIIATAVLAASAMVLISLIGLGAKYGNRAEERTIALSQAESLMDEFLAQLGQTEKQDEQSGILAGPPQRSYRIIATPFELNSNSRSAGSRDNSGQASNGQANGGQSSNGRASSGLLRVTVQVFESSSSNLGTTLNTAEVKPMIELSRLIRRPADVLESGQAPLQQADSNAMDFSQPGELP